MSLQLFVLDFCSFSFLLAILCTAHSEFTNHQHHSTMAQRGSYRLHAPTATASGADVPAHGTGDSCAHGSISPGRSRAKAPSSAASSRHNGVPRQTRAVFVLPKLLLLESSHRCVALFLPPWSRTRRHLALVTTAPPHHRTETRLFVSVPHMCSSCLRSGCAALNLKGIEYEYRGVNLLKGEQV